MLNALWHSHLGANDVDHSLLRKNLNLIVEPDSEKAAKYIDWMQVLVALNPDETLLSGKKLEHVILPYAGVRESIRENVKAKPHLKLYNSHYNAAFVAQHAVAILLACANQVTEGDRRMRQGIWKPLSADLVNKNLIGGNCLLLGYGAISKGIEIRARTLGMSISVIRRNQEPLENIQVYPLANLAEALNQADVIIASLPGTEKTKNLLNKDMINAMKSDAILINVGRGDLIDQHALYEAMSAGHLFAAGLDVWWNYPTIGQADPDIQAADVPLTDLPNVVMSPHRASLVESWQFESFADVAKTLNALAKGKERNRVNLEDGY